MKTTKTKTKRANNRKPAELSGWCQVRISKELAAASAQLADRSAIVRAALEGACKEARIPLRPRVDPKQLALPIVKRARSLKPPTKARKVPT